MLRPSMSLPSTEQLPGRPERPASAARQAQPEARREAEATRRPAARSTGAPRRRAVGPLLALALLLAAPLPSWAAPATLGPVRLELPPGFELLPLSARPSGALAPAPPGADRRLLGAAASAPLDASLTVALVEAPLEADAAARDVIATRATDHVVAELGLEWRVTAVARGRAPDPAFEVVGQTKIGGAPRGLAFLFVPTGRSTVVLTLAAPIEGLDALLPAARAVARSIHATMPPAEGAGPTPAPLLIAGAAFAGLLVALARRRLREGRPAAAPRS